MDTELFNEAATLVRLAQKLEKTGDPLTETVYRVAQYISDVNFGEGAPAGTTPGVQGVNFDPSQEHGQNQQGQVSFNPSVSTFVRGPQGEPVQDSRKEHTASITMLVPDNVSETDIINYMSGIKKALNVELTGSTWSVKPPKQAGGR